MSAVTTCKSPAHKHYAQAVEGLYIQTWIAYRDLGRLVDSIAIEPDELAKGTAIDRNDHKLVEVIERLNFGRREVAEAVVEVNRHFDRGCRNLPAVAEGSLP